VCSSCDPCFDDSLFPSPRHNRPQYASDSPARTCVTNPAGLTLDGEKKVICEGSLTKMALSGKNSWKRRHFKLVYAPAPRYAGPYLQYFEDENSTKEKGECCAALPSLSHCQA